MTTTKKEEQQERATVLTGRHLTQLWGRGLFLSETVRGRRRRFTRETWTALCKQASAWGISFVHPKVAEGTHCLYAPHELTMLRDVAQATGLGCFPTQRCYGNRESRLTEEAHLTAILGKIFGGICPEMGEEWEIPIDTSNEWANTYGTLVRQEFLGPVLPLLFACPANHPQFPYASLLSWCSGWMPLILYDEWRSPTTLPNATFAASVLTPQWMALEQTLREEKRFPPPLLPVIECGYGLPPIEIGRWLQRYVPVGYCGFWSAESYAQTAPFVLAVPAPAWSPPSLSASPISSSGEPALLSLEPQLPHPPGDPITPIPPAEPIEPLSERQQQVSWWYRDVHVPFDLTYPIERCWARLLQERVPIGAVTGPRQAFTVDDHTYEVQPFEGGRIFHDPMEQRAWPQLVASIQPTVAPLLQRAEAPTQAYELVITSEQEEGKSL